MTPDSLVASLRWRYATKQFDAGRSIPAPVWEAIEDSLVLTPSSFGLQAWKFVVVADPDLRTALRAESWNQPQITDASHLVVLAARTDLTPDDIQRWITRLAEVQGRPPEDFEILHRMITGYSDAMETGQRQEWNKRQVYIALGQLMAAAAVLKVDTCPLEGINPEGYDKILGLTGSGYATAVACALGYRDAADKYAAAPKARFEKSDVIVIR